jgi:hypothetical protein
MGASGNPEVLAGLLRRVPFITAPALPFDFDQRLMLQKAFYILQEGEGVPLGYEFNWYHHGPYSSALARDAFSAVPLFDKAPPRRFKEETVDARFQEGVEWVSSQRPSARRLELLGSLLYLIRQGRSIDEAVPLLVAKIPGVSPDEVREAWSKIVDRFGVPRPIQ